MTKALRHRCIHWNGVIRPCVIIAQALAIAAAVAGHLVAQGSSEGVAGAADLAFGAETPEPGAGGLGTWIEGLGPWAYVVAPLFTVIVAILPIPAELPAVLNGMLFGLGLGVAVTWGGAFAGALLSFELARRAGRPLAVRVIGAARMAQADRLMQAADWPALLVLRLIPVVAFTAINWGRGLLLSVAGPLRGLLPWAFYLGRFCSQPPAPALWCFTGSTRYSPSASPFVASLCLR